MKGPLVKSPVGLSAKGTRMASLTDRKIKSLKPRDEAYIQPDAGAGPRPPRHA